MEAKEKPVSVLNTREVASISRAVSCLFWETRFSSTLKYNLQTRYIRGLFASNSNGVYISTYEAHIYVNSHGWKLPGLEDIRHKFVTNSYYRSRD